MIDSMIEDGLLDYIYIYIYKLIFIFLIYFFCFVSNQTIQSKGFNQLRTNNKN
jgi:hypothetical protein